MKGSVTVDTFPANPANGVFMRFATWLSSFILFFVAVTLYSASICEEEFKAEIKIASVATCVFERTGLNSTYRAAESNFLFIISLPSAWGKTIRDFIVAAYDNTTALATGIADQTGKYLVIFQPIITLTSVVGTTCFSLGKLFLEVVAIAILRFRGCFYALHAIPGAIYEILNAPLKVKMSVGVILASCYMILSRFLGRRRAVTILNVVTLLFYFLTGGNIVSIIVDMYDEVERALRIADRLLPELYRCITTAPCILNDSDPADSGAEATGDEELRRSARALRLAAQRARTWLADLLDEGLPLKARPSCRVSLSLLPSHPLHPFPLHFLTPLAGGGDRQTRESNGHNHPDPPLHPHPRLDTSLPAARNFFSPYRYTYTLNRCNSTRAYAFAVSVRIRPYVYHLRVSVRIYRISFASYPSPPPSSIMLARREIGRKPLQPLNTQGAASSTP
jgi:hypothetical protein